MNQELSDLLSRLPELLAKAGAGVDKPADKTAEYDHANPDAGKGSLDDKAIETKAKHKLLVIILGEPDNEEADPLAKVK